MADRKQFEIVNIPDPELLRLLEETRETEVTDEELREQRISFAFGNALNSELVTKDTVRQASQNVRIR